MDKDKKSDSGFGDCADDERLERISSTKRDYWQMVLGGYLAMLPFFIGMAATFLIIYLIIRFVWGG